MQGRKSGAPLNAVKSLNVGTGISSSKLSRMLRLRYTALENYSKDEVSNKFRYRPHFCRCRSSSLTKSGMTSARIRSILVTIGEHSHYLTARCIFC